MKIALVHDWLNTRGGAEKVLLELHNIFPAAPIYTLFADNDFIKNNLPDAKIITSPLQKIPRINKTYPFFLPFLPSLVESFDFSDFDLVISSSVSFSKGIVLKPKTRHICYCYSPTRFLWDRHLEYAAQSENRWLTMIAQHLMRLWDHSAADRVEHFIAISETVKDRIKKIYQINASVIYPPIILPVINNLPRPLNQDYFLIVSRLYKYKNIDVAIEAFRKIKSRLIIIGSGPNESNLKKNIPANVSFLGQVDDTRLVQYYIHAKALLLTSEEDFGLTAVEAMSFGTPVIALKKGGTAEVVKEVINGELFDDPIPEALMDAISRYEVNKSSYNKENIKASVSLFSREIFKKKINEVVFANN